MLHTAWKGQLSFGLIEFPIKLHGAVEDKDIKLRTLHSVCYKPIHHVKRCEHCERDVHSDELIKGYETSEGHFVTLSEHELDKLKKQFSQSKTIDILHFVQLEEIDPIYFDKSYYISATEFGGREYSVLLEGLAQSGKVGIAKVFLYSKQQLAIIRSYEGCLLLQTLHFHEELRHIQDVPHIDSLPSLSTKDCVAAVEIINKLSAPFEPKVHHDDYRDMLHELIQNKEVMASFNQQQSEQDVTKLMQMLKLSIDQSNLKPKKPRKKTIEKKA